jgi:hypothetical protein
VTGINVLVLLHCVCECDESGPKWWWLVPNLPAPRNECNDATGWDG